MKLNCLYRNESAASSDNPRVVLAYSGGLDTTVIAHWLKNCLGFNVICCCVDLGQDPSELASLEENARQAGVDTLYRVEMVDDFCNDYLEPLIKANAHYGNYLLGTAIARPAMVQALVDIAKFNNADFIAHGATGKGNDQVRFELGVMALAPRLQVLAPWRMTDVWPYKSREDLLDYCDEHGLSLNVSRETSYSRDSNLWHTSHEGLDLEDPQTMPDYDSLLLRTTPLLDVNAQPEQVQIMFQQGTPIAIAIKDTIGGVKVIEKSFAPILRTLNKLGGRHGIGVVDMIEDRVVGLKSREIYETPGGTILMEAHRYLEELVLDRDLRKGKEALSTRLGDLIYEGKWFTPEREAIQAYIESTQQLVTGAVELTLYHGNIIRSGVCSDFSLYDEELVSFDNDKELYNHHDAEGFIKLFGLPLKVHALRNMD